MSSGVNKSGNSLSLWERIASWSPSGQGIISTATPLMRSSLGNNTSHQPEYIKKIQERLERERKEDDEKTQKREIKRNYASVSTEDIHGILQALPEEDKIIKNILEEILQKRHHEQLTTEKTQILEDDSILQQRYRNLSTPQIREKLQKTVEDIFDYKEKEQNVFKPIKKEEIFPVKKRIEDKLTPAEEKEVRSFKNKQFLAFYEKIEELEKEKNILQNILFERIKPYINISPEKIAKALDSSENKILDEKQKNAVDIIQIIYSPTDIEQQIILKLKHKKEEKSKASSSASEDEQEKPLGSSGSNQHSLMIFPSII